MKRIVCGTLLLLALLAGAAEQTSTGVVISGRTAEGELLFAPVCSGERVTLEKLPELLKRHGYDKIIISSWTRDVDGESVIAELNKSGIEVELCYLLKNGNPDWNRIEITGNAATPPPEKPAAFVPLLIEDNAYNRRYKLPGEFKQVKYVTIHNTAEPFTARQERDRVDFRRDNMSVSFHFAVDENEIVQILPLSIHGWHAGDGGKGPGNTQSIGIEICRSQCRDSQEWRYLRSEENAVRLAAALLCKYRLTADDLRMHNDWTGKFCPHRILETKRWNEFKERVAAQLKTPSAELPFKP